MYCAFDEADLLSRINDPDATIRLGGVQDAIRLQANTPAIIAAIKGRINGPTSEFVLISGSIGQAIINSCICALGRLGDSDMVSTTEEDYLADLIDSPPIISQSRNAEPSSFQYEGSVVGNAYEIDSELMLFKTSNYDFSSIGVVAGDKIVIRDIYVADDLTGVWIDSTYVGGNLLLDAIPLNTTAAEDVATKDSIIETMKTYDWVISDVSDDGYYVTVERNPTTQPFRVTDLSGGAYVDVTGHFFQVAGTPTDYVVYFAAIRLDAFDYAIYDSLGNLKYESYIPDPPVVDEDTSLFHKALTKAIVADALMELSSRKYVKPNTISRTLDNLYVDALASTNPELEVSTYATSTLTLAHKASRRYDEDTTNAINADIQTKFYSPGSPSLGCNTDVLAGEDPTSTCITYFSPIVDMRCANIQPVYVNRPVVFAPTVFDSSGNLVLDAGVPNLNYHAMSYAWDFGDGSYSSDASPTHTYGAADIYTAIVVVTDLVSGIAQEATCSIEVLTEYVTVVVPPHVLPLEPFCVTVTYRYSEELTIEPFGISVDGNGCYEVTLPEPGTVCGTVGPTEFCVTAVEPLAVNLVSDAVNCPNISKSFTATVAGGLEPYEYTWTVDGVVVGDVGELLAEAFEEGNHTVGIEVTDAMLSTIAGSVDFVIYPRIDAYINYTITNIAENGRLPGYTVDFAPCVTAAGLPTQYTYLWDFGDATTASGADQSHTYSAPAEYTISLRVADPGGCSEILDISSAVPVYGAPVILLRNMEEDKRLCPRKLIMEVSISRGLAPFSLVVNMGDGQMLYPASKNGLFSFEHFYSLAGTYTVHMVVTDAQTISSELDVVVSVG